MGRKKKEEETEDLSVSQRLVSRKVPRIINFSRIENFFETKSRKILSGKEFEKFDRKIIPWDNPFEKKEDRDPLSQEE